MYSISCKHGKIVFSIFCQLPALIEPYLIILEAWGRLARCEFIVPSEPHCQSELPDFGQFFSWCCFKSPTCGFSNISDCR